MSPIAALRQAAAALILNAPEPLVRRMLRELLAAETNPPEHPEWTELRTRVRYAMRAHDVSFEQVAAQMDLACSTVRSALGTRKPPTELLQRRLAEWLAGAQAAGTAQ